MGSRTSQLKTITHTTHASRLSLCHSIQHKPPANAHNHNAAKHTMCHSNPLTHTSACLGLGPLYLSDSYHFCQSQLKQSSIQKVHKSPNPIKLVHTFVTQYSCHTVTNLPIIIHSNHQSPKVAVWTVLAPKTTATHLATQLCSKPNSTS